MMIFYARKYKIQFLRIFDIIAIVAPLGGAFIRLGNLMNSEIIGTPSNLPWAFIFRHVDDVPRHPAQLYEAISYFIIFFWFILFIRRESLKQEKAFILE